MDPEEISKIAHTIRSSKLDNKKEVFKKEYSAFAESYPILFDKCCTEDPDDLTHLDMMIKMIKQIHKNKITNHVASIKVGQELFDAYISGKNGL